jgi:hypothetical protein
MAAAVQDVKLFGKWSFDEVEVRARAAAAPTQLLGARSTHP